jgi:hypothetical protein
VEGRGGCDFAKKAEILIVEKIFVEPVTLTAPRVFPVGWKSRARETQTDAHSSVPCRVRLSSRWTLDGAMTI